jgi:hypothetical protein
MSTLRRMTLAILLASAAIPRTAQQAAAGPLPVPAGVARDGARDFDFEIGSWSTRVRVLRNPLSGGTPDWAEYQGTSIVRPALGGRANLVELSVEGPAGRIEGVSLRLYNPQSHQWNINFASLRGGTLTPPVFGGFDGRGSGTFYGQDMLDGRAIFVRFVITQASAVEAHFEQAFSADGGASWEVNWIAVDRRS